MDFWNLTQSKEYVRFVLFFFLNKRDTKVGVCGNYKGGSRPFSCLGGSVFPWRDESINRRHVPFVFVHDNPPYISASLLMRFVFPAPRYNPWDYYVCIFIYINHRVGPRCITQEACQYSIQDSQVVSHYVPCERSEYVYMCVCMWSISCELSLMLTDFG